MAWRREELWPAERAAQIARERYFEGRWKSPLPSKTKSPQALEIGERGGRYYVGPTGERIYVRENPGAEIVGHMSDQRFVGGLPASAHLAEPFKVRGGGPWK